MARLETASKEWHIDDCASNKEWLEKRNLGIGASALGTLLGLSHYKNASKQKIYGHILGILPPDPPSDAMQLGHLLEPVVVDLFCRSTGMIEMGESAHDFLCVDNEKPWRRISPDRFVWNPEIPEADRCVDNAEILECKALCYHDPEARWKCVKITDENFVDLYPEYYAQVQYQMGVCRKDHCWIAWVDKGNEFKAGHMRIEFNKANFDMSMKVLDDFWNNNIVACVEPDEVKDSVDYSIKYQHSVPKSELKVGDAVVEKARRFVVLDKIKKTAEAMCDALKLELGLVAQFNDTLVAESDDKLKLVKMTERKGRVTLDRDTMKTEDPALYAKYLEMMDKFGRKGLDNRSATVKLTLTDAEIDERWGDEMARVLDALHNGIDKEEDSSVA